jgi:hypothetical protein
MVLLVAVKTAVTWWQHGALRADRGGHWAPRSKQPLPLTIDLRRSPALHGAAGARLSSALSSPLSSATRCGLVLLPRSGVPSPTNGSGANTNPLHVVGDTSNLKPRWRGVMQAF